MSPTLPRSAHAIVAIVLLATIATLTAAPADQRATKNEYALIDALNARIQDRFRNLRDERFGYGRVAVRVTTPHSFYVETASEADAVRDLQAARLGVIAYVVGRAVLQKPSGGTVSGVPPIAANPNRAAATPDASALQIVDVRAGSAYGLAGALGRALQGPVMITRDTEGARTARVAPAADDLIEEGRSAMLAFTELESMEFARDGWKFIARPVRATDAACLSCHRDASKANPSKPETLLGAVLYGFRPVAP